MPSHLHEVLIEMFRDRPALAADLLSGPLGIALPTFQTAHLSPGELTNVAPTEYRADAVVTLHAAGDPVLAVVVEVQLRVDPRKRRTWPAYVATLHARIGCPVMLLVMCPDQSVADWCAAPITIGESDRSDPTPIFEALLAALDVIDQGYADLYTDLVFMVLSATARDRLEEFMGTATHRYQSEYARRYFSQGEANALLAFLDARGIDVSETVRAAITNCTDLDQLNTWVRQAATAHTIEDLSGLNH
jgi:hypothetical protein